MKGTKLTLSRRSASTSIEIREVFRSSYRIVYQIFPKEVVVVAVFEGHRRLRSEVDEDE